MKKLFYSIVFFFIGVGAVHAQNVAAWEAIGQVTFDPSLVYGLIVSITPVLITLFIYRKFIKTINSA